MHALFHLVVTLAPLVAFASVSPVVFFSANTAVSSEGQRGGWSFVAGNAVVLRVLGTAFVGMLGTTATEFATRQIASSIVDKLLALVLIGYGVHLFWTHRQRTASEHGWLPPAAGSSRGSMACSAGE